MAKNSDVVCKKWLEKQCENLKCPLRHPRLTAKPVDTDNSKLKWLVFVIIRDYLLSFNAFCFRNTEAYSMGNECIAA